MTFNAIGDFITIRLTIRCLVGFIKGVLTRSLPERFSSPGHAFPGRIQPQLLRQPVAVAAQALQLPGGDVFRQRAGHDRISFRVLSWDRARRGRPFPPSARRPTLDLLMINDGGVRMGNLKLVDLPKSEIRKEEKLKQPLNPSEL